MQGGAHAIAGQSQRDQLGVRTVLHSLSQHRLADLASGGHLGSLVSQQVVEDLVLHQEFALQVTQLLGRLVVATRLSQVEHEFALLLRFHGGSDEVSRLAGGQAKEDDERR